MKMKLELELEIPYPFATFFCLLDKLRQLKIFVHFSIVYKVCFLHASSTKKINYETETFSLTLNLFAIASVERVLMVITNAKSLHLSFAMALSATLRNRDVLKLAATNY